MRDDFSEIKAIVFDMDGVLFLSGNSHEKAYREVLGSIGVQEFSYASIAGMRTDDAIRKILSENRVSLNNDAVENIVSLKRKRALELLLTEGKIASESGLLIDALRQRYRLALASSASPQTVEFFLAKSGYAEAFEFCLNGSLVKEAKPSPEIYNLALKRLEIKEKECMVIEDAESGVRAARSAGMQVLALRGTEESEKLLEAGAFFVAESLDEIRDILVRTAI